jgi:carbamoyltransferase
VPAYRKNLRERPWVLGISASHNGAVCLLRGDEVVAAVQEERLSGVKRHFVYAAEPSLALGYCLSYAGIRPEDLDLIVLSAVGRANDPRQDIGRNPLLKSALGRVPVLTVPHHYAHAVSAFATSGFEESAVLVVDGMGSPFDALGEDERRVAVKKVDDGFETVSLYAAEGTRVEPLEKHLVERGAWLSLRRGAMPLFGSLGGMFSAAAGQIFNNPAEAGKVMGLAPYGRARTPTEEFFRIDGGGCFNFLEEVPRRFAHDERWPARQDEYADLACSVQSALEDALLYLAGRLRGLCGSGNLCYAGGVALNSVANERLVRESGFRRVHIVPAAEDSGVALGAAYEGLWRLTKTNTRRRLVHDACGRPYTRTRVSSAVGREPRVRASESRDAVADAVDLLCAGKIVGWFDGRSELGPRALGQRSILCDPRRADGKEVLNRRVKRREAFRPFAPAVLLEEVENWFELEGAEPESPFMLRVCKFRPEKARLVPAVSHVDGTGRLQTLTKEANGRFYELVKRFYERTGVPMLLNTSFNVMGRPVVETPEQAVSCLLDSGLDCCVFEDRVVFKHVEW